MRSKCDGSFQWSNYDHTRMSDSLLVAFTVAEVPKHETICLHGYYWTNHIPRICRWFRLVPNAMQASRSTRNTLLALSTVSWQGPLAPPHRQRLGAYSN